MTVAEENMFKLAECGKFDITCLAHNSSGYDAQFILKHCYVNKNVQL
jgi:hypothetical protein